MQDFVWDFRGFKGFTVLGVGSRLQGMVVRLTVKCRVQGFKDLLDVLNKMWGVSNIDCGRSVRGQSS